LAAEEQNTKFQQEVIALQKVLAQGINNLEKKGATINPYHVF
jgi:hypothetical protein